MVGDRTIAFQQYDVWNHPSYATYRHINDSNELHVRLTYSNAALLEMMRVHLIEEDPRPPVRRNTPKTRSRIHLPTFQIGEDGAALMPYETLINPTPVRVERACTGRGRR